MPLNSAPTFSPANGTGKLLLPIGEGYDFGWAVALQPDGKMVIGGEVAPGLFGIVRLNSNGSVDATFGDSGRVQTQVGDGLSAGYSLALQPDGKIVVAGISYGGISGTSDVAVLRLNVDGSLDTSFDVDGKLVVSGDTHDEAWSVAIQPDGKIVIVGRSYNTEVGNGFNVLRLNEDGSLDTTFNDTGKLFLPIGGGAFDVCLQPDGKILVAGGADSHDFSIVRLNYDGSLDTTFNDTGTLTIEEIGVDFAYSIALQADGKIVIAGEGQGNDGTADYRSCA